VIVSVTARSAMRPTSGASMKRFVPSLAEITMPSKMFSRTLSCTRATVPTSTPSLERTSVPRLSALYAIA